MLSLLLPALLALTPQEPAPAKAPPAQPLSFASYRLPFTWNALIPINGVELDGLKVTSIYFNKRETTVWPLKGADFGTRAKVEVSNTAAKGRTPGFSVAVFDAEDRLLGVASGGTKIGSVGAGTTETFDLNFRQVLERLPKGDHFYLSIELRD
ncbi:hypothetical protein [Mesoterricola silvestris]|uniref:Uncharacterized protein n=1 Tax=Mesoterricola silvestris TaxID=2927979 RepID=A0AA48K6U7_9BACT|nr:hypothetical protein [Mesoterricola silvestris]BDU71179.1 hypothetical protein METEAL_03530 [Mesoterricola silvestris]